MMKKHKQDFNFVQMYLLARYTLECVESFILIFILLKLFGQTRCCADKQVFSIFQ